MDILINKLLCNIDVQKSYLGFVQKTSTGIFPCLCIEGTTAKVETVNCGSKVVTPDVNCGSEVVTPDVNCGSEVVTPDVNCGSKVVTPDVNCGSEVVTPDVNCGSEVVTPDVNCGSKGVIPGLNCGSEVVIPGINFIGVVQSASIYYDDTNTKFNVSMIIEATAEPIHYRIYE